MIIKLLLYSLIAFLLLPNGISFAAVPAEVDRAMKENMPYIKGHVKEKPDFWEVKDPSKTPARLGQPYQVYGLHVNNVIASAKDYKKGHIELLLIPDSSYWEYPLLDESGKLIMLAQIGKENGAWKLVKLGPYLSEPNEAFEFFSANEGDIRKYLREQGILEVTNIMRLTAEALHMELIYAETKDNDYLIPLFGGLKSIDIEQKKVYPAAEALTIIATEAAKLDSSFDNNNPLVGGVGGSSIQVDSVFTKSLVPLVVVLVAILVGMGVLLARRKRSC